LGLPLLLAGCNSSGIAEGLPDFSAIGSDIGASLPDFGSPFRTVSMYGPVRDGGYTIPAVPTFRIDQRYYRTTVRAPAKYANRPGTIVVDPRQRYLYLVEKDGMATRYGVGVGRAGFAWNGSARIGAKRSWPTWTPPAAMLERDPNARPYANGMPGGLNNPLGARALYLYQGDRDTLYRIHGTNEPWTIGKAVSSGCIRMLNQDVIDLYSRVSTGARVVVLA
jgi:lipoprotein-anchoring transpeptidase ErfK/SrfK